MTTQHTTVWSSKRPNAFPFAATVRKEVAQSKDLSGQHAQHMLQPAMSSSRLKLAASVQASMSLLPAAKDAMLVGYSLLACFSVPSLWQGQANRWISFLRHASASALRWPFCFGHPSGTQPHAWAASRQSSHGSIVLRPKYPQLCTAVPEDKRNRRRNERVHKVWLTWGMWVGPLV